MTKILPIVEGEGEVEALPVLLRKILGEAERWDIDIERPLNAHGKPNLIKKDGLEKFLKLAFFREGISGILVLVDTDEECAKELAESLAERGRALALPLPVSIVCATRCYEAWFLASMATIAGKPLKGSPGIPQECRHDDPPEERLNPKKWITDQLPGSQIYKETLHQVPLSRLIDTERASAGCRSFRRLLHAVDQLLDHIEREENVVTP